jgi:acyl-CoA synthetase (AMP-forming)/AMP-acid ligase II
VLWVLAKRGLLNPGPPNKIVAQLSTLHRWNWSLAAELRAAAERSPARIAAVDAAEPGRPNKAQWTYAELWERAEALALALRVRHGVGVGSRLGVLCRNHSGMIVAMVAGSALGAEVVLLNSSLSAAAVDAVVHDQHIELVLADNDLVELVPGVPTVNEIGVERLIQEAPRVRWSRRADPGA